jgi:replicative DNA helicase
MDAVGHGRVVLGAVIGGQGSTKALDYVRQRLSKDHFPDSVQQVLFILLCRYQDQTSGIMSRGALEDLLRAEAPGKVFMYCERYDQVVAAGLPRVDEFRHSVAQLRELAADRMTGDILAQGMEILRNGARDERSRLWHGHADARSYVLSGLADVERDLGLDVTPEGNVIVEGDEILADYAQAKQLRATGKAPGVLFGLDGLDAHLDGGLQNGEMGLIVAWTTAGKSSLCVQTGWHASVMQGKNVVFFTTEQLRRAVRIKLAARHSRHPKFGLPEGINDAAIRAGRLTEDEERALTAVLDDWKTGGYARCNVVQLPENATVATMAARYAAIRRQYKPDLVIMDYAQLLIPERKGRDTREHEDQSGIVRALQRWCATCDDGAGVPFLSPWQVNAEGRKRMKNDGAYDLEDMSSTKEAARTPGLVLALADRQEDSSGGRAAPLELTVLKNRAGPRGRKFELTADFATSYFREREKADDAVLGLDDD